MHIGFIATHLSDTDGVFLEVVKWARVPGRLSYEIFHCFDYLT